MTDKNDIMIDVAPGLTLYRVAGEWKYASRRNQSLEDVIKEVRAHAARLAMRHAVLTEAADAMERQCSSTTPT